ncbi:ABC-F family ATP-binding cassette domain-containing protein [Nonomuraea terrae]|uniref:ABC-F family ATP-binding cassette domain-containing protein n=1 Tax=Nonomuraea terrae TaxID=2530383 RepID=A0A4R4ZFS5_9ACTN|nr:ABC-F family ATP-binding cassette domain-containing protein [Nonomuraea terrae]TDD57235.1 ABC-F family ATP-binding cassette domain-containing protein [Nonomuraea terrae]
MRQLALNEITKRYGTRVVLDRVSLTVKPGERIGVIGDNGSGKSTLLRLMAGAERPDNGELVVVAPGGVGYLPQSLALPPHATVADALDLALADLRELETRMRAAERLLGEPGMDEVYAGLVAEFEARDGYEADARVEIALHGLGLPGLVRDRPLGTLSGGERSRLAPAATLASDPGLLLLDEPTNDLDDQAVTWLEHRLRAHRGTVVAITHDRVFLERVTDAIWEVADGQVRRYGDGYAGYLAGKAAERAAQARAHEEWKAELDRHATLVAANAGRLAVIPRKTAKAGMGTGAWRARSRTHGAASRIRQSQQRLRWLTDHPAPPPPEPLRFTTALPTAGAAAEAEVATLDGVEVAGRLRLDHLTVRAGERLLVTGPNGAGKTTLMRVLAGELRPDEGEVRRSGRIGFFRQDELDTADARQAGLHDGPAEVLGQEGPHNGRAGVVAREEWTVLRAYAHRRPGTLDEHADALLALGLFRPSDLGLRLKDLSYGQRRRIELARLVSEPVDLLLLDEPTNHLSPMLVEQLEEALASYQGALVVVTHDRRLRAAFTGRRLELDGGVRATPCSAQAGAPQP